VQLARQRVRVAELAPIVQKAHHHVQLAPLVHIALEMPRLARHAA